MGVATGWEPAVGAVVLVEPRVDDASPITAIVFESAPGAAVVLDTGASPTPVGPSFDAVASVFSVDRLVRVSGALRLVEPDRPGRYELVASVVERIERRQSVRRAVEVPATLTAFDGPGDVVSTLGHTIDLSSGGCRVVTTAPFPIEAPPTVTLRLGAGEPVRARAAILEQLAVDEGYAYRIVFTDIDLDDRVRIAELVAA